MGSGRQLAGRRRARRASAERQGPRLRLGRRQRDRDVPRARPHTRDHLGSVDGHPYTGQCQHRLQHLLQRSGASPRRADVHGRWKQGFAAQRHRPDSPLRFRDEPVEPRPEHGGRPLVSERHTTEQRRDAHHLGPRQYAGGPDAGRRPACAQHRVARLAVVSVDGRRAERPGLLFRSRPDDAHARHGRHRHVAGAGAARHDQPRLRRPRALRRGEDPRRRRWPLDQGRPGR